METSQKEKESEMNEKFQIFQKTYEMVKDL